MATLVSQRSAPKVIKKDGAERCIAFHIIVVEYCFSVVKDKGPVERIHVAEGCHN